MCETIVGVLKLCSFPLAISIFNCIRYFCLKRRIRQLYCQRPKDLFAALSTANLSFAAFTQTPKESGDDELDSLLFKTHLAAQYSVSLLLFSFILFGFFTIALLALQRR